MENNIHTHVQMNQSLFLQAVYEGTIEIMGRSKTEQIFNAISDGQTGDENAENRDRAQIITNFGNEFAIRYQRNTAKGLLLRIGEASFAFIKKNDSTLLELGNIENRLHPISERFETSLIVFAEELSELTALAVRSSKNDGNSFCLEVTAGMDKHILTSDLHLYFFMGMFRAFCTWLDSRKAYTFQLEEGKAGDPIGKKVCMKFEDAQ